LPVAVKHRSCPHNKHQRVIAVTKCSLLLLLLQVYSPLELLLFIAGCCTIADSFVPQLVNVPKATVNQVVRAVLSMSFVMGASVVVYNLKSRFCKEQAWNVSGCGATPASALQ
jgi:hypothetical protein